LAFQPISLPFSSLELVVLGGGVVGRGRAIAIALVGVVGRASALALVGVVGVAFSPSRFLLFFVGFLTVFFDFFSSTRVKPPRVTGSGEISILSRPVHSLK
jgi:hypothetical protein